MLKSKFEEIRMKDDKKFDEFYAQLNDIANTSFNLGEKIVENKIVKNKILMSHSKVKPMSYHCLSQRRKFWLKS